MITALSTEPRASTIASPRPNTIRAKYSGAEEQREPRERHADGGDDQRRHGAGEERAERGDAERGAGAALLRHLVAVERRHHRGDLAGHVDEDRGSASRRTAAP